MWYIDIDVYITYQYIKGTVYFQCCLSDSFSLLFFTSQTKDQTALLLCREVRWKNFTNHAVLLYHLHVYLWCPVSCCLITKCPPPCLLCQLALGLFPSPTTLEGNSGIVPVLVIFWYDAVLDKNMCFCFQYDLCCMSFSSSVVWTVAQDSPFTLSPSSCDLAPLKSTSFRVTYSPKQLNTLHGAQLECFAFYKVIL